MGLPTDGVEPPDVALNIVAVSLPSSHSIRLGTVAASKPDELEEELEEAELAEDGVLEELLEFEEAELAEDGEESERGLELLELEFEEAEDGVLEELLEFEEAELAEEADERVLEELLELELSDEMEDGVELDELDEPAEDRLDAEDGDELDELLDEPSEELLELDPLESELGVEDELELEDGLLELED